MYTLYASYNAKYVVLHTILEVTSGNMFYLCSRWVFSFWSSLLSADTLILIMFFVIPLTTAVSGCAGVRVCFDLAAALVVFRTGLNRRNKVWTLAWPRRQTIERYLLDLCKIFLKSIGTIFPFINFHKF